MKTLFDYATNKLLSAFNSFFALHAKETRGNKRSKQLFSNTFIFNLSPLYPTIPAESATFFQKWNLFFMAYVH